MSPAPKDPDLTEYSGRFAKRLRELRIEAELTVEEVIERIAKYNHSTRKSPTLSAYYRWEDGTNAPHLDLFPAIARAIGAKKPIDLLPEK